MTELRVVLSPSAETTRVIAISTTAGESETVLKARLIAEPHHHRAVPWLLEALALWQGVRVRAVLAAGASGPTCVTRLYPEWFTDFGGPLYELEVAEPRRRARHRDAVGLVGDFRDIRQLALQLGGAR